MDNLKNNLMVQLLPQLPDEYFHSMLEAAANFIKTFRVE